MPVTINPLRDNYENIDEFVDYSDIYGLAERLGYETAQEAWDANPIIQYGVNPKDFAKVRDRGIWDDLTAAGCELDNHESDLYVKDTPTAREVIKRFTVNCKPQRFRSRVDNAIWIDLPFMFQPFWDAKAKITA